MSALKHLPKKALEIADEQGWNEESVIIHLLGYMTDNVKEFEKGLELYFAAIAAEENNDISTHFLMVDGHEFDDPNSNLCSDGKFAPFYVFDADLQKNCAGPFNTREEAEAALSKLRN